MPTNETRSRDSTAIIITGDDAGIIDDTPDREGPFTEHDYYGEPTRHNYIRCPVYGAEVLDGGTPMASHRPAYHYE